ncbi:Hypothetical predicted protein [Octopus vulgaris]|uniref:Uncharacterized protein n=1 Tax=Octopus vulgaris TaxID=6645 RepID=A0AA36F7K4_OCTVU|nr:Hypothetical predicted protein [Octopus vulgaris]
MLEKLIQIPNKIPTPTRSVMMPIPHQMHAGCKIDVEAAFKSTWATNAFDGSEDYKVSDRIMPLIGPSMREFHLEMMSKLCPNTIQRVIKNLIPLKGVKYAINIEGLFDGDGTEEKAAESESEDESEPSGNLLEVIDSSGEIPMEVSQEPKHGQLNTMTGSSISFVGISSDDRANKDALFLEKIQKALDENETSTLFLPHRSKYMSTVSEARRSVKN